MTTLMGRDGDEHTLMTVGLGVVGSLYSFGTDYHLDDATRYLNTALLMRLLCEIAAIVIVTQLVRDAYDGAF